MGIIKHTTALHNSRFLLPVLLLLCTSVYAQKKCNITLVMPFCSDKILENPNHTDAELGNMSREYYQGALLAMDSFERAELPVKLTVLDTENDSLVMLKLIQKTAFKESDLVIGPVLQGGNSMLSAFAKDKSVFHVSPLMTFSRTKLNDPYWVSSNPDLPSYATIMYEYFLKQHKDSANIIVISDRSSALDKNISGAFKAIVPAGKNVKIRIVDYTPALDVNALLSPTLPNHVVIPSAKENVVNRLLYNIKDTGEASGIRCYGFQQWYEFKNIDYNQWEKKNVLIVTPYFVNYADDAVKNFVMTYRERFATEPSDAAFKGYDQLLFYGSALSASGKNFMNKIESKPYPVLHTVYLMKKQKEGFYQNMYLNFTRLVADKPVKVN